MQSGSTPVPSSLPPDLAEKVRTLPLDQLPELLRAQAEKTYRATLGDLPAPSPAPPPDVPSPPAAGAGAPSDGGDPGIPIDPSLVQQATAILAQEGLLPAATSELTPEVMAVLAALAEADGPGLSDLSQPEGVEEILRGVIDGRLGTGEPAQGSIGR